MADLFSTGHHVQKRIPTDKFHIFRTLCFFDVFSFFIYYPSLLLLSLLEKKHVAACILLWFVKGLLQNLDPDVLLVGACSNE